MKASKNPYLAALIILLLVTGAVSAMLMVPYKEQANPILNSKYAMLHPEKELILEEDLREISGLEYYKEGQLAGIQDEDGFVFILDIEKNQVLERIKFHKDADYEGIAIANNKVYVTKSNGDIYKIKHLNEKDDQKVKKYFTALNHDNNVEGLCYFPKKNQLLLACKEDSGIDEHFKHKRGIYKFDLDSKKLKKSLFLLIDEKAIGKKLDRKMKNAFRPSGIAINPTDSCLYVISSYGKAIAVYSPQLQLIDAVDLPRNVFMQPEGITFDKEGTMYIANEGRKGWGRILVFEKNEIQIPDVPE